ncbi:TetR-like C-terminal domain-containing protein [Lentilactobacillus sp. Marseille-Q4993]|uniref:TetR-like C-terminal domain-containing protein n=1 Tax=Lentilactobacillus sp. Marseille-Q4993 TaxID=3039492 RepID=UPI0024BC50DB|nr:TetR-like C-terminal domain-containing protein [Lentilactobacillus sp. Marseille-Q4993]
MTRLRITAEGSRTEVKRDLFRYAVELLTYIKNNGDKFKAVYRNQQETRFMDVLSYRYANFYPVWENIMAKSCNVPANYTSAAATNKIIGIIVKWGHNDFDEDVDTLARIITDGVTRFM